MIYIIQGPYRGLRLYYEIFQERAFAGFGFGTPPYVSQPVAISGLPYDVGYALPLDWARRIGDVQARYVHDHGGHFAAHEVPELLLDDFWRWIEHGGLSGTDILRKVPTGPDTM